MEKPFVHLHVHSDYSSLDGLGKVSEYVEKAISLGHPAIAITDHGQTAGAFELFYECKGKPIKPILGTEFYIQTELGVGHLVALAMDNEGWSNILKLQHFAFTKGFNKKACINMQALKRFNKGIIITSACSANPIGHSIKHGDFETAERYAEEFISIFGSRFYLELQSSDTNEQRMVNIGISNLSKKLGVETILTNDCHYVNAEDSFAHEVLLAVQTKSKMDNPKRFKFNSDGYHYKTRKEMIEYSAEVELELLERSLDNTLVIADLCNATINEGDFRTTYDVPSGKTSEQYLRELTTKKYKDVILSAGKDTKKYRDDVAYELDVICGEKYADYYLVVQDYINYARSIGQPVGDGRGSGVGSKVAYLTGITQVDPEPYNLPFERFLSKGRVPDSIESFILVII